MVGTDKWLICWIWINGVRSRREERLQLFPHRTPIPLNCHLFVFTNKFSVGWRFAADSWAKTDASVFFWVISRRTARTTKPFMGVGLEHLCVNRAADRPVWRGGEPAGWKSKDRKPFILQFVQRRLHERVWSLIWSPQTVIFHYCAITPCFNSISEAWRASVLRLRGYYWRTEPTTC